MKLSDSLPCVFNLYGTNVNKMDRSKDVLEHPNVVDGLAPCGTALHPQKRYADLPSIDSNSVEAHSFSHLSL